MTNPASAASSSIACLRMRIKIITGVVCVAIVLSPQPASAEKLTLACTFENGDFGRERDINQILIDTEHPEVDLRIAQTMGTNDPVNWMHRNDAALNDSIHLVSEGSKISVAAIRFGYAIVINFDRVTGLLNWTFADGSRAFRYRCR
jgi:hypothetical protein